MAISSVMLNLHHISQYCVAVFCCESIWENLSLRSEKLDKFDKP